MHFSKNVSRATFQRTLYQARKKIAEALCTGEAIEIGGGAKQMLSSAGIELISGVEGNIESAVTAYLSGNLCDMGGGCDHSEHEPDHVCDCKNHCD